MSRLRVILAFGLGLSLAACGSSITVPQHSGYKGKNPKPWEKAKELKLGGDKLSANLDYADYHRARWFWVSLAAPGQLEVDMEVTPGGASNTTDDDEGENMDVAIELLDPDFNVIAQSDLTTDDAHELKKSLVKKDLVAGRYLVHVYLEGRLDAADVDLKAAFTAGGPGPSDFPNQVAFVDPLAAIPPFDDTPAPTKVTKVTTRTTRTTRTTTTQVKPDKPDKPDKPGAARVQVSITDTQADASGAIHIVIGGGTTDGLDNNLSGSVVGVKGSGFRTSGCGASTCRATVKGNLDDIRNAGAVIVTLKPPPATP